MSKFDTFIDTVTKEAQTFGKKIEAHPFVTIGVLLGALYFGGSVFSLCFGAFIGHYIDKLWKGAEPVLNLVKTGGNLVNTTASAIDTVANAGASAVVTLANTSVSTAKNVIDYLGEEIDAKDDPWYESRQKENALRQQKQNKKVAPIDAPMVMPMVTEPVQEESLCNAALTRTPSAVTFQAPKVTTEEKLEAPKPAPTISRWMSLLPPSCDEKGRRRCFTIM
jgi:hypothetical protein